MTYVAKTQLGLRGFTRANLIRVGSPMRSIKVRKKSYHWCDNRHGRITDHLGTEQPSGRAWYLRFTGSFCARGKTATERGWPG
jgi:hypothetical protein